MLASQADSDFYYDTGLLTSGPPTSQSTTTCQADFARLHSAPVSSRSAAFYERLAGHWYTFLVFLFKKCS